MSFKGLSSVFRGVYVRDVTNGSGRSVSVEFHGLYADLLAARPPAGLKPASGNLLFGLPTDLPVKNAEVVRDVDGGGFGTMTVLLEGDAFETAPADPAIQRRVREVVWTRVDRPLIEHPSLSGYRHVLRLWLAETSEALRQEYKYHNYTFDEDGNPTGSSVETIADPGKKWADKFLRGVETWRDSMPVARLTEYFNSEPSTSACGRGHIEDPVGFSNLPVGYDWLKTSDEARENSDKTWSRVREWEGVDGSWDADIYGNQTEEGA